MLMPAGSKPHASDRPAIVSSSPMTAAMSLAFELGAHDLVAADILDLADRTRACRSRPSRTIFRTDAELDRVRRRVAVGCARQCDPLRAERAPSCPSIVDRHDVHARRADEIADEGVAGRSNSSSGVPICTMLALVHHHHLVGEGQRLGLVVGDVDHGVAEARGAAA